MRRTKIGGVVGLDLSLTSTGMACIPRGWTGDVKHVVVAKPCGYSLTEEASLEDHIDRMMHIASEVCAFVMMRNPIAVYVENYAFSQASTSATTLRELGGVVKAAMRRADLPIPIPVTASACRKTLLQKLPKAKVKEFTQNNVRRLKGEALYWNGDQIDAVVVANHGCMLQGWVPLSFEGI